MTAVPTAKASDIASVATVSSIRGQALFEGREPLSGMLRGHTSPMPAEVVKCGGCHNVVPAEPGGLSQAPSLDAKTLLDPRSRRNGPPSAYTLESFCQVVRSGVDPVHVMVSRTMPLFVVSPEQCESLWLYVMDRGSL